MLQDIQPHIFNNTFTNKQPQIGDYLFLFYDEKIILKEEQEIPMLLIYEQSYLQLKIDYVYLFSLDGISCYLGYRKTNGVQESYISCIRSLIQEENYKAYTLKKLQGKFHREHYFLCVVAEHISSWMNNNRFCSKCKAPMRPSSKERALICSHCDYTIYPNIPPAAIVAVMDGDRIFLARGKHYGAGFYSLIAGYTEIGETLEQTAEREVYEETGLKIKNIQYYKSQPWPQSGSIMVGFTAQLYGSDLAIINREELEEAHWFYRNEVPDHPNTDSIAAHMIHAFKIGEI